MVFFFFKQVAPVPLRFTEDPITEAGVSGHWGASSTHSEAPALMEHGSQSHGSFLLLITPPALETFLLIPLVSDTL